MLSGVDQSTWLAFAAGAVCGGAVAVALTRTPRGQARQGRPSAPPGPGLVPAEAHAGGAGAGAGGAGAGAVEPEVFELKGQHYQWLGEAWDHQTKDFKVLYKPLYCCSPHGGVDLTDRFEAHILAVTHYARWAAKFQPNKVRVETLPADAKRRVVPAGALSNPAWPYPDRTRPVDTGGAASAPGSLPESGMLPRIQRHNATPSGWGTRSYTAFS